MNIATDPIGRSFQVQRIRNLAIGLIREAGYAKIAATIRKIKHDTALLIYGSCRS